jgi:hypothetical protein
LRPKIREKKKGKKEETRASQRISQVKSYVVQRLEEFTPKVLKYLDTYPQKTTFRAVRALFSAKAQTNLQPLPFFPHSNPLPFPSFLTR